MSWPLSEATLSNHFNIFIVEGREDEAWKTRTKFYYSLSPPPIPLATCPSLSHDQTFTYSSVIPSTLCACEQYEDSKQESCLSLVQRRVRNSPLFIAALCCARHQYRDICSERQSPTLHPLCTGVAAGVSSAHSFMPIVLLTATVPVSVRSQTARSGTLGSDSRREDRQRERHTSGWDKQVLGGRSYPK
jgi:hypothetical protein